MLGPGTTSPAPLVDRVTALLRGASTSTEGGSLGEPDGGTDGGGGGRKRQGENNGDDNIGKVPTSRSVCTRTKREGLLTICMHIRVSAVVRGASGG